MNIFGRTPADSGIPAGVITPLMHTSGSGRKGFMYRVQFNTMYFKYSTLEKATKKLATWEANGRNK